MAKKEFIGLTYEYDRIRMARIRAKKSGIELLEVDTIYMPHPVVQTNDSEFGAFDLDLDTGDELGDLFDLEEGEPGSEKTADLGDFLDDPGPEKESKGTSLEEDFDMTQPDDEIDSDNDKVLADYLSKFGSNKLNLGIHIPFGKSTFQFFKNVDPGSMRKKDRLEFFKEKLGPIHSKDVHPEDYSWEKIGTKDCLVSYTPNQRQLLNLIEVAETYFNGKLLINERLPDEAIWAALAATNYDLGEDDITGLIGLSDTSTRMLFMKGNEIINILPIITEGESSEKILNTIFSKILFEIDKGDLPKITRLLITRSAKLSEKAKNYLSKQFDDVEVDFLTLNPEKVTYAEEILDSPLYLQPYLSAIGAAWAASKIDEKEFSKFSTIPEYILEKQRVMKLEWHGIVILILIALTPLYLNNLYYEKADELQQLQQQVISLEMQIDELRPIATMTEDLIGDLQLIQSENDRLLELAAYSQKWSEVIQMKNSGVSQIPNIWITSLRTVDENISLTGMSLTRQQIPQLANLFSDANIQQVSETEIRNQPVYSFSIQANNYRQDIDEFLIEMPVPDFNSEINNEFQLDFSENISLTDDEDTQVFAASEQSPAIQIQNGQSQISTYNPESIVVSNQVTGPSSNQNQDQIALDNSGNDNTTENWSVSKTEEFVNSNQIANASPYGLMGQKDELLYGAYTIVLHSLEDADRAEKVKYDLQEEGYKTTLWPAEISETQINWRVGVGQFETIGEALSGVQQLPEPYRSDNFIIRIR